MDQKQWYVKVGGKDKGPFSTDEVIGKLKANELNQMFYAFNQTQSPMLISQIPDFQNWQNGTSVQTEVVLKSSGSKPVNAHEIDYRIVGDEMQYVEIELDPAETIIAEAGAMMYMTDHIKMETVFGDGSQQSDSQGLFGKLLGAGKRLITGESLFMTTFTNIGNGKKRAAFASPYPGKIIPIDLNNFNGKLICQKDSFLCAAKGVAIGIEFNKRLSVGLFGGEGFIMQKLEGDGMAFIHASGTVSEIRLNHGERLKIDTGCLVALTKDINYDIEMVGGIKSMFFAGEGICFATVTGPGTVWVQSLPFGRLAARVLASSGGARKEEGSSLLGGIGTMLGGNR